jgi:hypothetical protein
MSNNKGCRFGCVSIIVILIITVIIIYFDPYLKLAINRIFGFFIFLGYNAFFIIDNLFFIDFVNPIVIWGIWGFLFGSIFGVYSAVKKFNLNPKIIFIQVLTLIVIIVIMAFINKPLSYDVKNYPEKNTDYVKPYNQKITVYKVNSATNLYSSFKTNRKIILKIAEGSIVNIIDKGFYDKFGNEWYKISFRDKTGYIQAAKIDELK